MALFGLASTFTTTHNHLFSFSGICLMKWFVSSPGRSIRSGSIFVMYWKISGKAMSEECESNQEDRYMGFSALIEYCCIAESTSKNPSLASRLRTSPYQNQGGSFQNPGSSLIDLCYHTCENKNVLYHPPPFWRYIMEHPLKYCQSCSWQDMICSVGGTHSSFH